MCLNPGPMAKYATSHSTLFQSRPGTSRLEVMATALFRAVAYAVTGSEDQHAEVRQLVCEHINGSALEFDGTTGDDYLQRKKMRELGVWGTKDECQAVADWLQVPVFVLCQFGSRLSWQKHTPRSAGKNQFGIYLDNSSGCHYNIVMSVGRK